MAGVGRCRLGCMRSRSSHSGTCDRGRRGRTRFKRLGYRSGRLNAPGSYVRNGNEIRAILRAFTFSDSARPATEIRRRIADHAIDSLDADEQPTSLVRLEPPLIGSFFATHGEDRLIVTPEETPPLLMDALKVVEDRNFDTHAGFDLKGIARAAWADLRAGDLSRRQHADAATREELLPRQSPHAAAQTQGTRHGGDPRCALHERRPAQCIHQ